jgi:hypothetical protein
MKSIRLYVGSVLQKAIKNINTFPDAAGDKITELEFRVSKP